MEAQIIAYIETYQTDGVTITSVVVPAGGPSAISGYPGVTVATHSHSWMEFFSSGDLVGRVNPSA